MRAKGFGPSPAEAVLETTIIPRPQKLFQITASDNLLQGANVEAQMGTAGVWIFVKQILVLRDGLYRVKFDIRTSITPNNARGRIYISGTAVGTERINATAAYITYSEDIPIQAGDTMELWVNEDGPGTVQWRNFRIYGDQTVQLSEVVLDI